MIAQNVSAGGQSSESIVERVKSLLSKMTWKHALVGLVPLVLYIYPRPILKPFVLIAAKLNRNHPEVACHDFVHQVILTTNPAITQENLSQLEVLKGVRPDWSGYKKEEIAVIELFLK
jgi:hypothetical protein